MEDRLHDVAARAARYLAALEDRAVAPDPVAVAGLAALAGPLPQSGRDAAELVALLDEIGAPASVASAGPRYFGFVTGGALPAALAANWLAAAWDQNAFSIKGSPLGVALERCAIAWLTEAFGLAAETGGALVTGATMANFTGLAAARHAVLADAGWDVEAKGLTGAPPVSILAGDEAHSTLFKALGLLGLGRDNVIRVPADDQGRMRPEALPEIAGPAILCLQAGNVNSGAFEPAAALIPAARAAGAWVHVDGAFGLWARACPEFGALVQGVERADSWAIDGHKWLQTPYDSGFVFVRDEAALYRAMSLSASYLPNSADQRDPGDYTPELSRRARGFAVWAVLSRLGRAGVAEMVARHCRVARRLAARLAAEPGVRVLNEVVLNQVVVAFGPESDGRAADAATGETLARIQREGICYPSHGVWNGRAIMRISVTSQATDEAEGDRAAEAIIAAWRGVRGEIL